MWLKIRTSWNVYLELVDAELLQVFMCVVRLSRRLLDGAGDLCTVFQKQEKHVILSVLKV